ncbi:MAG: ABC1 kinase family protein, partial [Maioricimonas sp. JB049]
VPTVYEELTCESVLTMQFLGGCRADDDLGIARLGVAPSQLAANGARIFMKMAFALGIFHGDPHPGNIRIQDDGSIGLIDYGMVGYLDRDKRDQLVDLFVAIVHQNVDDAVRIVEAMGNPSRPIDDLLLHADVQDFVETYYGVELARLNVGNMLSDFVSILSLHGLRCPADLMLLIRAIVTLEGVGRRIDPQFNLAGELAPYVEKLVKRRYDPKRIAARAMADFRELLAAVHSLPIYLGQTLEKLSGDELKVQLEHRSLDRLITEFDRSSNRITVGLVTSSLIVAFALIIRSASSASSWITVPVFALSGMLGIWLIYGILRSGRL